MGRLGAPPNGEIPDPSSLDRFVLKLRRACDPVGIIRIVERWAQSGELTIQARLAQAWAFLQIKQMDRAWVRLREVTDAEPDNVEALLLTAEMYIGRGWPRRARGVLESVEKLDPTQEMLAGLKAQATEPPLQPPANTSDIERFGSQAEILGLAEQYLATGSQHRARSLLEGLRRTHPDNIRVDRLLWGLEGDYVNLQQPLQELLNELQPAALLASMGDHLSVPMSDITTPDMETAEVGNVDLQERLNRDRADFPSLFRRGEPVENDDAFPDDEVTEVSGLASEARSGPMGSGEDTDPRAVLLDEPRDTEIMEVIAGPGSGGLRETPFHKPKDEVGEGGGKALDLRRWQQSMGMHPGAAPPTSSSAASNDAFLEEEDQDLVVMTRRETRAAPVVPAPRRGPIEVVEKVPKPMVMAPAPQPEAEPAPAPAEPPPRKRKAPRKRRQWRVVVALCLMFMMLVVVAVVVAGVLIHEASVSRLADSRHALAVGDYEALVTQEAKLANALGRPLLDTGELAAELALVRGVLWTEYTGSP